MRDTILNAVPTVLPAKMAKFKTAPDVARAVWAASEEDAPNASASKLVLVGVLHAWSLALVSQAILATRDRPPSLYKNMICPQETRCSRVS